MPADALTALARRALTHTLTEGGVYAPGRNLVPELAKEAGVVVSLYTAAKLHLRGQAGDILPVYDHVAEEICDLVAKAALADMRFDPVSTRELPDLAIAIDVVTRTEELRDIDNLDPSEDGLFIVSSRGKTGFLIPNTPGVRIGEQALNLLLAKTDIELEDERVSMFRFGVERHAEVLF